MISSSGQNDVARPMQIHSSTTRRLSAKPLGPAGERVEQNYSMTFGLRGQAKEVAT
ncbi:MAG: hypothetical protein JRE16_00745 [Deltaproteobacteria bacterium]|jgi:hypothetical protein|nr:hypothetical protein [Deltaproteobacteria bacterium]MBW2475904.1 hypothetical protein [Deltaproteobacteria bacterium]MBW2503075.1 hypothetical protein [Deltaproteobacteria bacterium]MBW2519835.1 hypothetical protein [Deltaproteobacteria bacterium]